MMRRMIVLTVISMLFLTCSENSEAESSETQNENEKLETVFVENFDGGAKELENFYFNSGGKSAEWAWNIKDGILKAAMDPQDAPTPYQGQNFTANNISHFGRYSARIKIPSVETQPNVGGVVGFFTYYNDLYSNEQEKDINKNGLSDNSEIDFEWVIANPKVIYLSAWTDYEESGKSQKISKIINMANTKIKNYDASKNFYTYGFDWKPDNIRWWIINPENESDTITLWSYRENKEKITQKPAYLSFNIWHTNDWAAEGKPKSIEAPTDTFRVEFDWIKYETIHN